MSILIRQACSTDLKEVADIEAASFPSAEADSFEMISFRLNVMPDLFLIAEIDNRIVGFINALPTNVERLKNDFYVEKPNVDVDAEGVAAMSLDVDPLYRRRGIAIQLMNDFLTQAQIYRKKFVTLVCKADKIPYYQQFGFKDVGVSTVTLGGAQWNDMILRF